MKKLVAILLLLLSSLACKASDHAAYIGLWQTAGDPPKTFEITKDGDSYLLTDLRATDFSGKKQAPRLLSEVGAQLAVNTGAGTAPLGLSADRNTLYFDKWTFTRVPKQNAEQVKNTIQSAQLQRQSNREQCEALGQEFEAKRTEISRSNATSKTKLASNEELKKGVVARAEKIPDCKRMLMLY